ncbi:MAG: hypothetical protein IJT98_10000 [Prevotella sp.]|nr:hypothetical protein [Prevotella sp.]
MADTSAQDLQSEETQPQEQQPVAEQTEKEQAADEQKAEENMSTLQKMKKQVKESDDESSASLRFRDILGGDYLWALAKGHIWLIMLVVFITTAYVAVRYQCQQDAIDISQLEKKLIDAKFQSLSSSSNLTRMCRQGNIIDMLRQTGDTLLQKSQQPPYIIEVRSE